MADMEIDNHNIITVIINLMEEVEKIREKNGKEKKEYVLFCLKTKLGNEIYERYEPIIKITIDFIVEISKGDITLHLNKIKNKFCCF